MCPKLKRFGLRSPVGKTGPLDREHPRGSAVRLPDGETIPCGWGARLVPGAPHLGGDERGTQMSPAPSHAVLSVWLHCLAPRLPHHKMQLAMQTPGPAIKHLFTPPGALLAWREHAEVSALILPGR